MGLRGWHSKKLCDACVDCLFMGCSRFGRPRHTGHRVRHDTTGGTNSLLGPVVLGLLGSRASLVLWQQGLRGWVVGGQRRSTLVFCQHGTGRRCVFKGARPTGQTRFGYMFGCAVAVSWHECRPSRLLLACRGGGRSAKFTFFIWWLGCKCAQST